MDAYRDDNRRFFVRADELRTAFLELEEQTAFSPSIMNEAEEFKEECDMYATIALKGPQELRETLRLTEDSFRFVSPYLWEDPRAAFIYRVLDEVMKAGMAIKDWSTKLKKRT